MSIDFAHTRAAEVRRAAKAQTLARWCYARGVLGPGLLELDPALRRIAARAAGVSPSREVDGQAGETWHLVVELLRRKLAWDATHGVVPPAAASCLECAIREDWCDAHQPRRCTVCGGQLHRVFLEEGSTTHPSCDLVAPSRLAPAAPPRPAPAAAADEATLY